MTIFSNKMYNTKTLRIRALQIAFILFSIYSCKTVSVFQKQNVNQRQYNISEQYTENEEVNKMIDPYRNKLDVEMNKVLAQAEQDMTREDLNSSLANFLADAFFAEANDYAQKNNLRSVDFVMLNSGGIRSTIKKGDVTVGDIFEIMPFENEIVIAELSGDKVWELLQYINSSKKGHPVSNLFIEFQDEKFISAKIAGKPFDKNKTYIVATNDYLQSGGDDMKFFMNPLQLYKTKIKVRDAFIKQIAKVKQIPIIKQARIKL